MLLDLLPLLQDDTATASGTLVWQQFPQPPETLRRKGLTRLRLITVGHGTLRAMRASRYELQSWMYTELYAHGATRLRKRVVIHTDSRVCATGRTSVAFSICTYSGQIGELWLLADIEDF